jgi:hypothetical protein
MRKGLFVSFLLLLSPLCFAQQTLINDVEFFSGMPFFYGRGENLDEELMGFRSKSPSFAGGIGLVNYSLSKDNTIGFFFIYENYYMKAFVYNLPNEKLIFNQGSINKTENYQIGVKIQILEEGNFKFPLMFGISSIMITATANPSSGVTCDINRTIGGMFFSAAAELHFNKSIFFFARVQTTITVFAITDMVKYTEVQPSYPQKSYYVEKSNEFETGFYTTITPVIGVGLKINGLFGK